MEAYFGVANCSPSINVSYRCFVWIKISPNFYSLYLDAIFLKSLLISKASSSPIFLTPHPQTTGRRQTNPVSHICVQRNGIPGSSQQCPRSCHMAASQSGLLPKPGPPTYTSCPLVIFCLLILLATSFHIPESYPVFIYFLILFLYSKLYDYSHCSCLVRLGRFHCAWIGFQMRLDKLNYGNL